LTTAEDFQDGKHFLIKACSKKLSNFSLFRNVISLIHGLLCDSCLRTRRVELSAARDQGLVLQTTSPLSTASLDLMVYYSKVRNNRVMTPHGKKYYRWTNW